MKTLRAEVRHFVVHDGAESPADFDRCDQTVHDVAVATQQREGVKTEENRYEPDSSRVGLLLVIDKIGHILDEIGVQQCTRLRHDRYASYVSKFTLKHVEQAISTVHIHTLLWVLGP